MRRFSLWLRGQPFVADTLLAGVLVLLDVVGHVASTEDRHAVLYWVTTVVVCAPMPWRRRRPRTVAAVVLLVSVSITVSGAVTGERTVEHLSLLAVPIMLYTLVAYVGRVAAAIYLAGLAVDLAALLLLGQVDEDPLTVLILSSLLYALAWTAGEFLGARMAYDQEVAARLAVADYDRDRRAEEAVAAERTRIARELHDVVAHGVSVMIVQADGASFAIRRDPDRAEHAVQNISNTGRQALAELRRTVALLRTPHADEVPVYGTAGLARVVDLLSRAGLHVELEQTGNLDDIGPAIGLGVHRLVQESLTNVLRHGGHAPRAWVAVMRHDDRVVVDIVNNLREADRVDAGTRVEGSGNGLVGMRERVAVLQGTLDVGPTSDGRWRVHAELPLE